MKFGFVVKHRGVWPVGWLCEALSVSRSGFHAWLSRPPSLQAAADVALTARVRASFVAGDRTHGAGGYGMMCLPRAHPAGCIASNG